MKSQKGKVVAVLAEKFSFMLLDRAQEVMGKHQADVIELRLDCLEPQYLHTKTIETVILGLPHYPLIASIRNTSSVPENRRDLEGFQSGKHDLDRIALLRKATELEVQYFELEHQLRRNFFLGGDRRIPQAIISYYDVKGTPPLCELGRIYEEILRQGADYVKIETLVRTREDRENLLTLMNESSQFKNARPLTVVGRGKLGRDVNLEAYLLGSPFVYGIVPSDTAMPLVRRKRTYQELPTLDELNAWIEKHR